MSFEEIQDARIREDAYRTMRMLAWALISVIILYMPVVVLAAVYYGWQEVERVLLP